ncbi:MAG: M61 family metallopeptidase [Firmicutes bacterium]|nr:M61 family metallopeptidase [Bacillota bacterium]
MKIAYHVAIAQPQRHLLQVVMQIEDPPTKEGRLLLEMPVWTPGAYEILDFAQDVPWMTAQASGTELAVEKTAKNRWEVQVGQVSSVTVRYAVYAHALETHASHVDDRHAYWNGATVFLYLVGHRDEPVTLDVEIPQGGHISTGLRERSGEGPGHYQADDYDELIDAPVEVGTHASYFFEVRGIPHELAVCGKGNLDPGRLIDDLTKVIEAAAQMMGGLPYTRYLFLLHLSDRRGGGLEHRNSTSIIVERWQFGEENSYRQMLRLFTHEYFHLWNVKRIRPQTFWAFDYTREQYTHLLWLHEGVTDYYAELLPYRAGIEDDEHFLDGMAELIRRLEQTPGRRYEPVTRSSFDTWIKEYRRTENRVNDHISYYLKGCLVGWLLDLTLQRESGGGCALDDVMRTLYTDFYEHGQGVPEDGVERSVEKLLGRPLDDFFSKYVYGTQELPWDTVLPTVGLQLERRYKQEEKTHSYLGVRVRNDHGHLIVASVLEETPAMAVGIAPGDELLTIDGFRLHPENWQKRLADHKPGEQVRIGLFRQEELLFYEVTLAQRPPDQYKLIPVADVSEEQRAAYRRWTHRRLSETQTQSAADQAETAKADQAEGREVENS